MSACTETVEEPKSATRNACKLCAPLGASLVFKGVRGCLPFLHGSQGCATYIRRYMISHFREPVDIASSSFSEEDAIFGGSRNFTDGLNHVIEQYRPEIIGVATTCLSETIGENMLAMISDYQTLRPKDAPPLVHVSTPSYSGTHAEGFTATILELVRALACKEPTTSPARTINVLPSIMSCTDLRTLREDCRLFGLRAHLLPDYSETLEGESWDAYHRISPGGTPIEEIATMGHAAGTLEIGQLAQSLTESAGSYLKQNHGVPHHPIQWPLGVRLSDAYYDTLAAISGSTIPDGIVKERGRLVDSYVDAHKYLAGQTAAVFGEPDLVVALAAFLSEIGVRPVLCATGAKIKSWRETLSSHMENGIGDAEALSGADHAHIREHCLRLKPTMLIGSSKGYPLARELGVPLLRIGFPIHDRIGAQRILSVGYRGTQELFDRIVNTVLETKQDQSTTGYSYL